LQGIAGYFQKTTKKRCQKQTQRNRNKSANIETFSNKIQTASNWGVDSVWKNKISNTGILPTKGHFLHQTIVKILFFM
jgi:hypothetical protein